MVEPGLHVSFAILNCFIYTVSNEKNFVKYVG